MGRRVKIELVGDSYQAWSLPFNAERTVNLFPVVDNDGKEIKALYGTAGYDLVATAGAGPVRGSFRSKQNGRVFFVSANFLYEANAAFELTNRGSLENSEGNITIAENSTQLAICDGNDMFIFTYSSNAFAKVTDPDLPSVGTVTSIGSYFVVNSNDTDRFYISELGDGFIWAALEFSSAESSPDKGLRVFNAFGSLWIFGEVTTEIYSNTGSSGFPFTKVSGGDFNVGILAPYSAQVVGRDLFWLGQDDFGRGQVYKTSNISPQKVSTEAVDIKLQAATNPEDITSWVYQEHGHAFYALTGGGLDTTLVYDTVTGFWHERAYTNVDGVFEQHRAANCLFAFGVQLIGDRVNGNIYQMSMDKYTDNNEVIVRERVYKHISNEDNRISIGTLEIGLETGVGLENGDGSDPQIALYLSKDGGRTYNFIDTKSFGELGNYYQKVRFAKLGIAEQITFKIRIAEPVKVALTGSYLKNTTSEARR